MNREPLAIVGMACRFPGGVSDPASFWKLLVEQRTGIIPVPRDRWNRERWYHQRADIPGKMITKWAGFVHDFDMFDAQFFGISPREALRMDPQQRWLLEVAWESLEDAGMPPVELRGSPTSVFVGIGSYDYASVAHSEPQNIDVHTPSGSSLSIASNRISYLFDLKGPAVSVDTACSSALVAVNLACESIWSGQSTMALAGGVNALLTPDVSTGLSKASMLSPSGQCFAFDERANGYVRGEGAGLIVIKPLRQAVSDGDRIYCTIRAAVINQDGHTSSMTVPGVETQAEMLRIAYRQAGLEPKRVRYVEAHGTGTPVGDPIEARALGEILAQGRDEGDWCLIGSVKTNIGHLESGAGVAGLIKAALVLHHDTVPANLNFKRPNPNIPFEEFKLKVATELQPLPHLGDFLPVAAVNSFGFGGTNAHIVLEANHEPTSAAGVIRPKKKSATISKATGTATRPAVLPISGRTEEALRDAAISWRRYLRQSQAPLGDIASAAGRQREALDHRLVVVGQDREEVCHRLTQWLAGDPVEGIYLGRPTPEVHPLVFVFTGQGAQWWKMGQELLEREPVFRRALEKADTCWKALAGWSLVREMTRDEAGSRIGRTNIAQPAIFGLQVALAELWKSWGIEPAKVIGHSVGEVAAAYVAGALSIEDAVKVVYHRSRLQDTTRGHGRMVAAGISETEAKKVLSGTEDRIQVAAVNSPGLITLAGDTEPLEEVVATLEAEHKFIRWLPIEYALHTHQMEPIRKELLDVLADIQPKSAQIPFISTVTGDQLAGEKLDAGYWWRNVRETVQFAPAITGLIQAGDGCFLEIGPHPALQNPIQECLSEQGCKGVYFNSLKRKSDETVEMLGNLSKMHLRGYRVDWAAVNQSAGIWVDLPKNAWQRERFWLESAEGHDLRCADEEHPLLGLRRTASRPTYRFELDPRVFTWLDDHRVWGSVVFPAAGYGEIGLALARKLFPGEPYVVEELEMKKALFVTEQKVPTVEVVFDPDTRAFQIFSATGNRKEWELNSQGVLRKQPLPKDRTPVDLEAIKAGLPEHVDHQAYYEDYSKAGYQFRPLFQHLQNVWRKKGESFAEMVAPEGLHGSIPSFHFHPAVLDACFHTVKGGHIVPDGARATDYFYLPAEIRSLRLLVDKPPLRLWGHAKVDTDNDRETLVADIDVYDDEGRVVAEVRGFRADRVESRDRDDLETCLYQEQWEVLRLKGTRIDGPARIAASREILADVSAALPALYKERRLHEYYDRFMPRIDRASRQFIVNAFLELGWKPRLGDRVQIDTHMRHFDIADRHRKLVYGQFTALEEGGWLKPVGDETWEVIQVPQRQCATHLLDKLAAEFPRFAPDVDLQRQAGPNIARILSGEINLLEVLFRKDSSRLLETFYREGMDHPVINPLVGVALRKVVENLPPRRAIRVLEVGAGTGSLTREILPVLPANRTEYAFTDVTPFFLQRARDTFGEAYPFVEYALFDCERGPADQGIEPHAFDIVLASNVIHATTDLKHTIGNLRRCLAPDGLLMFLETTWHRAALDNVFGLLPGWWRFADADLRPHSALLSRSRWEHLLTELGFRDVTSFSGSPRTEEDQQACFLARAPGSVDDDATGARSSREAEADEGGLLLIGGDERLAEGLGALGMPVWKVGEDLKTIAAALDRAETDGARIGRIVHALALKHPRVDSLDVETLNQAQDTGVRHVHELFRLITGRDWTKGRPKLFVLTRGALPATATDSMSGLASAPLTGFLRVANNENAEFQWAQVDLDPAAPEYEMRDLCDELLLSNGEPEVAYRGHQRHVRRVRRVKRGELAPRRRNAVQPDGSILPYRLQIEKPGILTNLSLNETVRREPGPDEVEVLVKAGGVNARDVLKALGTYPGNPVDLNWFGDEFSGVVERVGSRVADLKPGDSVAGVAPYCFRSHVTVDRRLVFRKPDPVTHAGAATLPAVFLTAYFAINELARMRRGESILIHAGTGGVGQAAIQIARHLGLTIFSTAGSEEERALLRDMGVDHALDSHSLVFGDQIMAITKGRGVDAVLNSPAGDFIPKNVSVLASFGRYLEIGKADGDGNYQIGLETVQNNISFHVIDLMQLVRRKPAYVAEMLTELERHFLASDFRPLLPKVFPITQVVEAFGDMAGGPHIGKNVLDFDVPAILVGPVTEEGHRLSAEGTWLITGGAGGFGLELAGWMAANGARHFALMSRSGPKEDALPKIQALRALGCMVTDARADVTKRADVERVVASIQESGARLTGVIHGAMVLEDEFIVDLDRERFDKVLLPKMLGAWNLHKATLGLPLEQFICFSSFSSVVGNAKQSNYNAGNVFLNHIARYRRSISLPSLTFNWGAIKGAGLMERNDKTRQFLAMIGFGATDMNETLTLFDWGLRADTEPLVAARVDWTALSRFNPSVGGTKVFVPVVPRTDAGGNVSMAACIHKAPHEKRMAMVGDIIAAQAAAVLGTEASRVALDTPLAFLGLDSVMAVDLVSRIGNTLGIDIPIGWVLNGASIQDLSLPVLRNLLETAGDVSGGSGGRPGHASPP